MLNLIKEIKNMKGLYLVSSLQHEEAGQVEF